MRKNFIVIMLVFILTVATACSGNNGSNDGEPSAQPSDNAGTEAGASPTAAQSAEEIKEIMYGPFKDTVNVSVIQAQNPQNKFPEGDSYDHNPYLDYLEKTLNVKVDVKWKSPVAGEAFNNKFKLMIASNDLADIFLVNSTADTPAETILKQLSDEGMIEPMGDLIDKYADPGIKEIYAADDDNGPLKKATFNGQVMAIPNATDISTGAPMLWLRQDWLDKLNLPAPKTMEDVAVIAKAFKEQDPDGNGKADTFGLGIMNTLFQQANLTSNPIFWNLGGRTDWTMKGGKAVYGPAQPEMKAGLAYLQDLFKQGLIDPEFPTRGGNEYQPYIVNGKMGLFFGVWFAPAFPLADSLKNDPKADWRAYGISNDQGEVVSVGSSYTTSYLVVRKGYEHPELAIKFANLSYKYGHHLIPELYDIDKTTYKGMTVTFGIGGAMTFSKSDQLLLDGKQIMDAVAGTVSPDVLDDQGQKDIYDAIIKENENPLQDPANWVTAAMYSQGLNSLVKSNIKNEDKAFTGTTKTMVSRWTDLQTVMMKAFIDIIENAQPLDYFDTWAEQWRSQGGDQITEEVNQSINGN